MKIKVSIPFVIFTFLFLFVYNQSEGNNKTENKLNVIMITCHDIGQHLGCYGVNTVQTPNIDKLAEKGIVFRNAYSTSAVCSPGRGSLHTGRYPQSNGLMGLTHAPWWWRLNPDEKHTAQILNDNGYQTYLVGFNHIDPDPKRLGYQYVPEIPDEGESGITHAAIDLIEELIPEIPVFIKIGYHLVHRKFTHGADSTNGIFVPPYLANTREMRNDLAEYQAQIHCFDQQVGEILKALEKSEIAQKTLVVFTSDHGIPYPGAKWSARRAGIQVPFIFYMPQSVFSGGKQFYDVFSNVDFLPTLLSCLDIDIPQNMQGMDFMPFIEGKQKDGPRKYAFAQYTTDMKRDNLSRSVITNNYQLIRYFDQGRTLEMPIDVHPQRFANHLERAKSSAPRPYAQLFDIQKDPYELIDVAGQEELQKIKNELSDELLNWMKEVGDMLLKGPQKTPYYEKAMDDFLK
jgi:arylsulfatase A-like enzyme